MDVSTEFTFLIFFIIGLVVVAALLLGVLAEAVIDDVFNGSEED